MVVRQLTRLVFPSPNFRLLSATLWHSKIWRHGGKREKWFGKFMRSSAAKACTATLPFAGRVQRAAVLIMSNIAEVFEPMCKKNRSSF